MARVLFKASLTTFFTATPFLENHLKTQNTMNENNKQPETLEEVIEALDKMEAERDMYKKLYYNSLDDYSNLAHKLNAIKEIININ